MKAVIVSDTHGSFEKMKEVINDEKPFDVLIHCGDVCDDLTYVLGRTDYQVRAVAGNCDIPGSYPETLDFELGDHKVFVAHGHRHDVYSKSRGRFLSDAKEKGCDIACFGHTHVPDIDERIGIVLINPGSLERPRTADGLPSYGVIDIDDDTGVLSYEIKLY